MPDSDNTLLRPSGRRGLTRRTSLITGAGLALAFLPVARAAPDPQALLAASDAIRNPSKPFKVTVTLTEFDKGVQVNSTTLLSVSRTMDSGQFASIIRFMQPVRDAGKLMLRNGSDLWFYDPGTKAAVRISPQQRLLGQASNGDVVTVNFARDYKATLAGEEEIKDGERKLRASHKLQLAAASPDATYGAIELWLDAASQMPLKARFIAESGRLLKTAFYRRVQPQLGLDRPTETVIIDGVDPQSVTLVRLSDYGWRNAPASWFQRDHLPHFSAD